jgi:mono/diheme cytochrome c family protein
LPVAGNDLIDPSMDAGGMGCWAATGVLLLAVLAGCGGPDLGVPPAVCSTMAVNEGEGETMEPGGDCIGCHSSNDGPSFLAAGTVMASQHDDTNCNGVAGVTVRLRGADGRTIDMTTNRTGNFFYEGRASDLALPFTAEVIRGGKTNAMLTAQTTTNCASCHTAEGANLAPGRILAP